MTLVRRIKHARLYREWHFEIGILVLFIGLALVILGLLSTRANVNRQAARGEQAYRAVCTYRGDLQERVHQGITFLKLTQAQRIKQFGPVIGTIPPETIRTSLANEERAVASLKALAC